MSFLFVWKQQDSHFFRRYEQNSNVLSWRAHASGSACLGNKLTSHCLQHPNFHADGSGDDCSRWGYYPWTILEDLVDRDCERYNTLVPLTGRVYQIEPHMQLKLMQCEVCPTRRWNNRWAIILSCESFSLKDYRMNWSKYDKRHTWKMMALT